MGVMKIRFAISPGAPAPSLEGFGAEVQAVEALGFDTIWLSDVPLGPSLDPVVGLSFAAAATSSLKLGANVVPIGRNPLTLAKSLAQVDRLSGGRLLLNFVVGLDQPGERLALGASGANRGRLLEDVMPLLRAWWAGRAVTYHSERLHFDQVASPGRPQQDPLEVWFGGTGQSALDRAGRLADGWLGSALSPSESAAAREQIQAAASKAGRAIDPEHFGISIPYAPTEPDRLSIDAMRARRPDADLAEILPVGADRLRALVVRYVDAGLSKFVIRSADADADRPALLGELADVVLPMQT
jgi:probable F420-dependent oxidoreductase